MSEDAVGSLPPLPVGIGLTHAAVRNTTAQMAGRILAACGRLVVTAAILRVFGRTVFAEYAVLFGVLGIAEKAVDFGTTEVFTRELSRARERSRRLLRVLTATKMAQVPVAAALLIGALIVLRYPQQVVEAGSIGAIGLIFVGLILVYQPLFQTTLTLHLGVIAETISVIALIPMVFAVAQWGRGLLWLLVCHVISRAIYFAACFAFARKSFTPAIAGVSFADVRDAFTSSIAFGVIGFLFAMYDNIDIIIMSKVAATLDVAYYAAAQKLLTPLIMALSAIGGTLYPIASSYWPKSKDSFYTACQRAVDVVLALAGVAVVAGVSGAAFFMGLIGRQVASGAPTFQILILVSLAKGITWTIAPVLYVLHAQKAAVYCVASALVVRAATTALLAKAYGSPGVAAGVVVVEIICLAVPALVLVQLRTGYRWRLRAAIGVAVATLIAITVARFVFSESSLAAAAVATALYILIVFGTNTIRLSEVSGLLQRRQPR